MDRGDRAVNEGAFADLEALVGTTKRTVEGFRVEAGKVEEFARAVGDDNPAHRSAAAAEKQGRPAIPASLTFPRVSSFPRYRVDAFDLGFDPQFVLHGEQRYEYARPLYVGDVFSGETTLADVYQREGRRGGTMTFAEFVTEYTTDDGEHVLTEFATAIETDGAAEDSEDATTESSPDGGTDTAANDGSTTPTSASDNETADDLVGLPVRSQIDTGTNVPEPTEVTSLTEKETGPSVTVGPFARQDFVRYAGASGDFNPIHYDEPFATGAGHRSVFGQGMLTAGVAAHAVADFVGIDRVRSFGVRFQAQVWPGDTVTARTTVTDVGSEVTLRVTVDRESDGETVVRGTATADTQR